MPRGLLLVWLVVGTLWLLEWGWGVLLLASVLSCRCDLLLPFLSRDFLLLLLWCCLSFVQLLLGFFVVQVASWITGVVLITHRITAMVLITSRITAGILITHRAVSFVATTTQGAVLFVARTMFITVGLFVGWWVVFVVSLVVVFVVGVVQFVLARGWAVLPPSFFLRLKRGLNCTGQTLTIYEQTPRHPFQNVFIIY